jgi:cob(I)alamin adenosyltransferase
MISEDELYEITSKADPELFCDFISGFRAAEKIYLDKIKALEEKLEEATTALTTITFLDLAGNDNQGKMNSVAREWLRQNERGE